MIKIKKSQGLPVNVVVMMIIGIIIFGLGFSMFTKFTSKGEEQISDLTNQIKNDIANLECNSNDWICSPSNKMKSGDKKTFNVFIVNNANTAKEFKINIKTVPIDNKQGLTKDKCGSVIIGYPQNIGVTIQSGSSGSIPFQVIASRVKKTPCSFVTTATLKITGASTDEPGNDEKTSIIIRIE